MIGSRSHNMEMNDMRTNAFSVWALWNITMIVVFLAYKFGHPELAASWVVAGTGVLLACSTLPLSIYAGAGAFFSTGFAATINEHKRDTEVDSSFFDLDQPVDPWAMQRHLMRISEQRMAAVPTLTTEALMYYALILEEAHEMGENISKILAAATGWPGGVREDLLTSNSAGIFMVCETIQPAVRAMDLAARRIRRILESPNFERWEGIPLNLENARDLMDDTGDVTTVNCGFALALGVPAAEGFQRLGLSNLSKANPDTGKIEKDPSGKWIKGRNYRKPELDQLLLDHFPELQGELPEQPIIRPHVGS